MSSNQADSADDGLKYVQYDVHKENVYLDPIRQLIAKDLSGIWSPSEEYAGIVFLTIFRAVQYLRISILPVPMGQSVLYGTPSTESMKLAFSKSYRLWTQRPTNSEES